MLRIAFQSAAVLLILLSQTLLAGELYQAAGKSPVGTYQVGIRRLSWTQTNGQFQVRAKAFYPIGTNEKHPVIIFSHGLGGSSERFDYLGQAWASEGIISIHLNHSGSDESQWRGKIRALSILSSLYQKYWSGRDRALLVQFVLDRLMDEADQPGTIASQIDFDRIGVAGNDLGALAALLVAGQLPPDNGQSLKDSRVKAVLALSPPVFCTREKGKAVYGNIETPCLSIAGTRDDGVVGTTKAEQRRIPFDSMSKNRHYHATLQGADHQVYSDYMRTTPNSGDAAYRKTIIEVSSLFWSAYLMDNTQSLAMLDGEQPALLSQQPHLERKLY